VAFLQFSVPRETRRPKICSTWNITKQTLICYTWNI